MCTKLRIFFDISINDYLWGQFGVLSLICMAQNEAELSPPSGECLLVIGNQYQPCAFAGRGGEHAAGKHQERLGLFQGEACRFPLL